MEQTNVISKGSYSTFRFNDFVSVRQYLLIREKGEKFLLLKLSNDASETATGLKLVVHQLDVRGVSIATNNVEWDSLKIPAKSPFIAPEKIPLKENCVEVKINLVGATYGEYTYAVKSNELVVVYDKKAEEDTADYSAHTQGNRAVTREHTFKRPLSLFVAAVMVLVCALVGTLVQLYAFKKTERQFVWKGVEYEFVSEDKSEGSPIRIIGYTGGQSDVYIPAKLESYPITGIAASAFRGSDSLKTLTIEANVEIYSYAFEGCNNLESVTLSNVTKVGDSAFSRCSSLSEVTLNELQTVSARAFSGCTRLHTLTVKGETQTLTMGNEAFANCGNLTMISIEQAVQYPQIMDVFKGAYNVQSLTLKHYNSAQYDGNTNKKLDRFFGGTKPESLTKLTIYNIDCIPEEFCAGNYSLREVSLKGVSSETLAKKAFYGCGALEELSVEFDKKDKGFTVIEDYALYGTQIETFNGKYLTEIGAYAFGQNSELISVNVTESAPLHTIGMNAFEDCTALKTFYVPKGVTALPEEGFRGCSSLSTLTFANNGALTEIGNYALYNCEALTEIILPSSTETIGESAFTNCKALTSIGMGKNLKTIGKKAFNNCESLTDLTIPASVQNMGENVLQGCTALQRLETPFVGCTTNFALYAMFNGSVPTALQSVTLTGDKNVADYAFSGVSSLKSVSITGKTASIGYGAFQDCKNLRELRLNADLQTIADNAFGNCYLLFEVWNLSSLPITRGEGANGGVAQYALAVYKAGDVRLESVNADGFSFLKAEDGWYMTDYLGTDTQWKLPKSFTDKGNRTVYSYTMVGHLFEGREDVKTLSVPSAVTFMGENIFTSCQNLTTVSYDENVALTEIAANTYAYCYALTEVRIPALCAISKIGSNAFYSCSALKDVTLPDGLQKISDCVFSDCNSLISLSLPDSVQTIGNYAFTNCSSLTSVSLPSALNTLGTCAFSYCSNLTSCTVGDGVTSMGWGVWNGAYSLKRLTIPYVGETEESNQYLAYLFGENRESDHASYALETVTVTKMKNVPEYAFYGFNALKSVQWNLTMETIGDYAFAWCQALQSISLPNGLTHIGNYAFSNAGLSKVTLPKSLQSMGESAFAYNQNLVSVGTRYNCGLENIPAYAFNGCTALAEFGFNNLKVTSIGNQAFYNTALTSIALPGTVNIIDANAFNACRSLKTAEFNDGLETIGYGAFADCTALEMVKLPKTLTWIENDAFWNCTKLYEVYNLSDVLTIECGSSDYGQVAYNAIIVHTNANAERLQEETLNGMTFKYVSNGEFACVTAYEGADESLMFNGVWLGGKLYGRYSIYRGVFQNNDALKEVDTGVVSEIGVNAFNNCSNLKMVRLGANLEKVDSGAFSQCASLWEVHDSDNANFALTAGSDDCGKVAYYAIAINQNISYWEEGDFRFMAFGGTSYLYKYTGSNLQTVELPEIGEPYVLFKHPMLYSAIFASAPKYLVIPVSVSYIRSDSLSTEINRIYYKGATQEDWQKISSEYGIYSSRVYYYRDCFHEANKQYWTYKDGKPSIKTTDLTVNIVVTEATCNTLGVKVDQCPICNERFNERTMSMVKHSFTAENGGCKWCGQLPVTADLLGIADLVEVKNSGKYKFFLNENNEVYSDWRDDYKNSGDYTVYLSFTAKEDISFSCVAESNGDETTRYTVKLNGEELDAWSDSKSFMIEQDLKAGDEITVEIYIEGYVLAEESRIKLHDIKVSKIVQEED